MGKKCVVVLKKGETCEAHTSGNEGEMLAMNQQIMDVVTEHKNKITQYYQNKTWDKFKKLSNEYEMIYTTPNSSNISGYNPVSRSFFKLWEMLSDFHSEIFSCKTAPLKCAFLAEGPGGFVEAFMKYRIDVCGRFDDECYGMTLKAGNDKNVPEWKANKDFMKKLKILYGADNTGNLYNIDNILHLRTSLGANSMDIITADGGFDFSADFNNQEEQSFRLILCELVAAILLQKQNGTLILKIFDMFNTNTLKMIQFLSNYYKNVYIVKPFTSRPANSERYLVCVGFEWLNDTSTLERIIDAMRCYDDKRVTQALSYVPFDKTVLKSTIAFNSYYAVRQVYYIERTIDYIHQFHNRNYDENVVKPILDEHTKTSTNWCTKYHIPIWCPS